LFRRHVRGIAALQDSTGLWHQVLDQPDSYLETSCSAMFCYAMAKGIHRGWLGPEYARHCVRAWGGVATRVRPDGLVEGICRGTEVGFDLEYYRTRPTPLNDPRGLGAILLAGSEMQRLTSPQRPRE
jgi:rhamnogalacturonyl hydrolase YesR